MGGRIARASVCVPLTVVAGKHEREHGCTCTSVPGWGHTTQSWEIFWVTFLRYGEGAPPSRIKAGLSGAWGAPVKLGVFEPRGYPRRV